jgi:hypothetical protein
MPEFIDRINNPEKYPFITNEDSSISTHRMAADQDKDGNWYAHPMIVQLPSGELKEYTNQQQALENNLLSGNVLPMKSKEAALAYAKNGYKLGTPLEEFNPSAEQLNPTQDNSSLYTKKELLELGIEDGSKLEPKPELNPTQDNSSLYTKKELLELGVGDDSKLEPEPELDSKPKLDPAQDNSSLYTDAELLNFSDEYVSPQNYITEKRSEEKYPFFDDISRGVLHGLYGRQEVAGANTVLAGVLQNKLNQGSGEEKITKGLELIKKAEEKINKVGIKKSDTFDQAEGFEVLTDFLPYQLGSVLPMLAEVIGVSMARS